MDQYGRPVAGAVVIQYVSHEHFFYVTHRYGIAEKTAADGTFTITTFFSGPPRIEVAKAGYDFMHGSFIGDTGNKSPTEFALWKRRGAEPMVKSTLAFDLPYGGPEVRVDLLKGKKVKEGGDLVFRLHADSPASGKVPDPNARDWHLDLSAVDGGLDPVTPGLLNEAPEDGYTPKLDFDEKVRRKKWGGGIVGDYAAFSRRKLYSQFHLSFSGNPAFGPGTVHLSWSINPQGSRNLEYDGSKDVTQQYQE